MNNNTPLLSFELGYVKENAVIALLLAPVLPVPWSLWVVLISTLIAGAGWWLVYAAVRRAEDGTIKGKLRSVFLSEEMRDALGYSSSNTLSTLVVFAWCGVAGIMYSLESFLPVFVSLQILAGTALLFLEFDILRKRQNE